MLNVEALDYVMSEVSICLLYHSPPSVLETPSAAFKVSTSSITITCLSPIHTHDGKSNSSKVGDPNSAQKQLKELSTEARLLLLDRAIKSTLIQGQEDIQACLRRLESLEKLDVSLPILAKCWTVIETLRKVCVPASLTKLIE
ncbi:unnamed protein product [Dibothriocephalus latus]|uniref:Lens epithelium-derived growth factor integrase-binding domain-containing protein n=1 Tax=Dibothriocephalus latus TaxID=60516 RepID=A0A3P7NNH0_DIBLA|nr:unnamed protein product [Dibothriocephalus latus]